MTTRITKEKFISILTNGINLSLNGESKVLEYFESLISFFNNHKNDYIAEKIDMYSVVLSAKNIDYLIATYSNNKLEFSTVIIDSNLLFSNLSMKESIDIRNIVVGVFMHHEEWIMNNVNCLKSLHIKKEIFDNNKKFDPWPM